MVNFAWRVLGVDEDWVHSSNERLAKDKGGKRVSKGKGKADLDAARR
jgi:hypothetical protein